MIANIQIRAGPVVSIRRQQWTLHEFGYRKEICEYILLQQNQFRVRCGKIDKLLERR